MSTSIKVTNTVGFGLSSSSSINYVIEEDQPMAYYTQYNRTLRVYHGDDPIKALVTSGTLTKIQDTAEVISKFGFAFSGGDTANTPYPLGSSGVVEDIQIEDDMYDLEGNIIHPTFVYNADSGSLIASEKCYGLVTGNVTVPYTLYGFDHDTEIRNDLGGMYVYLKSLMYVFGIASSSTVTHNISAVLPTSAVGESDKLELWRIVSYRYITDETANNIYEKGINDPYEFLPFDYQGDKPKGARLEVSEVHELAYLRNVGKLNSYIDIETFLVHSAINTTWGGININDLNYPHRVLLETYNKADFDEKTQLQIQKAIQSRKDAGLGKSNMYRVSWKL